MREGSGRACAGVAGCLEMLHQSAWPGRRPVHHSELPGGWSLLPDLVPLSDVALVPQDVFFPGGDEVGWMDLLLYSLDLQVLGQRRARGLGQGTGWPSPATAAQPLGLPAAWACLLQTVFLFRGIPSLMTARLGEALPGCPLQEALLPPMSVQRPLPTVMSLAGPPVWGTDFISPLTCSQSESQRHLDSDGPDQMLPRCPLPSDPPSLARRVPLPPSGYRRKTQVYGGVITGHKVHPLEGTVQRFSVSLLSCAPTIRVWTLPVTCVVSLLLILNPPSGPDDCRPCSVSTHGVPSSGRST